MKPLAKQIVAGAVCQLVGVFSGAQIGLMLAPTHRILPDGTETWVCGNEYMEPGMAIGFLVGAVTSIAVGFIWSRFGDRN